MVDDEDWEPDTPWSPEGFAGTWWEFRRRHDRFKEQLLYLNKGAFDFSGVRTDDYDLSLEIDGVPPTCRLNDDQQRMIYDCGFRLVFINHTDSIQTHYTWGREGFTPMKGWRRRSREGGFDINYWPEGWGDQETGPHGHRWVESGYMTIIPDL